MSNTTLPAEIEELDAQIKQLARERERFQVRVRDLDQQIIVLFKQRLALRNQSYAHKRATSNS